MVLRVHNTLSGQKEEFIPRDKGKIAMYVCGPTVYNYIHVGNARCYLTFDMVRRYFEYMGYEVLYAQNYTDIDDKIINQAAAEGVAPGKLAEKYIEAFDEDMTALQVAPPDISPKATEHIAEMLEMIGSLVEKGLAYEVDGDVYYAVNKFAGYGKLSHRSLDDMEAGARVEIDTRKKNPMDFALWKAAKPGEPSWDSPWGKGRPGWHIECSTMSLKYLGFSFDIHGGGLDLIFPHHENEIAQAEGASGKEPFVRYWLHNGFVTMSGEKMAKSVGNVIRLRDVLGTVDPQTIRILFLGTHYRSPIDFNDQRLKEAGKAYERLNNAIGNIDRIIDDNRERVKVLVGSGQEVKLKDAVRQVEEEFVMAMDDDFNAPDALGAVFTLIREVNSYIKDRTQFSLDETDTLDEVKAKVLEMGHALGLSFSAFITPERTDEAWRSVRKLELTSGLARFSGGVSGDTDLFDKDFDAFVGKFLELREKARAAKDWDTADSIRNFLGLHDILLEDTSGGTKVRIKKVM